MSDGQLQKLTIHAFTNSSFKEEIKDKVFTTLINPENYSLQKKVEYEQTQATGTSANSPKFNRIIAPDLEIQIIFDSTGVLANTPLKDTPNSKGEYEILPVTDQIKGFEDVVLTYNGNIHKPNHLMVIWGDLIFKGVLSDISYEYKLFKPDGSPLRATAKVTLKDAKEEDLRAAQENNKSPDLTHVRMVVEGDTLPNLSKKIYGDSKYYLEVAKANGLTNFRRLTAGSQLYFPPIDKLTAES
jgi:hypothetical protein